jgi:hypothetical protein
VGEEKRITGSTENDSLWHIGGKRVRKMERGRRPK